MATNNFTQDGGEWNNVGNWSLGHVPTASEDVTVTGIISASKTLTITTTAAVAKSIDFTGAAYAFTISGSPKITISGSMTLKTGMTWSHTGEIRFDATATLTCNSVNLSNCSQLDAYVCALTLADELNLGTKDFWVVIGSIITGNNTVTCGRFYDGLTGSGSITLTLGTSVINCTNTFWGSVLTLTVTSTDHTINISNDTAVAAHFAGKAWGIVNWKSNASAARAHVITFGTGATFVQFNIDQLTDRRDCSISFSGDFSVSDSSTWKSGGAGNDDPTYRLLIKSSTIGTTRTLTVSAASKTITITDVDLQDIKIADTNSPTVTVARVGDCGGCNRVDVSGYKQNVSDPKTVYLNAATANVTWVDNVWATVSTTGTVNVNNFPLAQDTAVIDNDSYDDTNNTTTANTLLRIGNIDASAVTENQSISLGATYYYGSILLGSGIGTFNTSFLATIMTFDGRVRNELSSPAPLVINIGGSDKTVESGSMVIDSYGGTVQLDSALLFTYVSGGTVTLTRGTFDLNGQTITTTAFSSSNSNTRTLKDDAGGGKIVINALTGTGIGFGTDTNLTIEDAPDIDVGDSNNTMTGAVTLAFGSTAKTFGDLSFKKHAGNYAYIITGTGHTFGAVTQETPDATYQYNSVTWPVSGSDNNIASYNVTGHATYKCYIQSSSSGSPAHLEDINAGTNTFTNCIIQDMHVTGGTWDADDGTNTNTSGNEGWTWPAAGGVTLPILVNGVWKNATPKIMVGGAWKEVAAAKIMVDGAWKAHP